MWVPNSWLCIIDIKNQQSEYSNAIQLIRGLERLGADMTTPPENTVDLSSLWITRIPRGGKMQAQIAEVEARLAEGNPKRISNIKTWEQLEAGIEREPGIKAFSYYIRVDILGEGSDLSDLRYLVLLMQSIPEVCNKLGVFFFGEGITGDKTFRHFDRLSQFLRFIQIKYGAFYALKGSTIKLLDTAPEIPISFLPVLEIDKETYKVITNRQILSAVYHGEDFDRLFTAIGPANVADYYVTTLFQVGLRMFFRALNGKQYLKKDAKPQLLKLLCHTVQEAEGVSVLDILLFGALMSRDSYKTFGKNEAAEYLHGVKALSGAIAQVLENITKHSQYGKGVFTIRHQKEQSYIQKNYPSYQIENREYGLELLITATIHIGCETSKLGCPKSHSGVLLNRTTLPNLNKFVGLGRRSPQMLWRKSERRHSIRYSPLDR